MRWVGSGSTSVKTLIINSQFQEGRQRNIRRPENDRAITINCDSTERIKKAPHSGPSVAVSDTDNVERAGVAVSVLI